MLLTNTAKASRALGDLESLSRRVRLIMRLWDALLALAERIHSLVARQRHEAAEWTNCVLCLCLVLPTWVYPHYLDTSPFLAALGAGIGRPLILGIGTPLLVYWIGCLLLCGDESPVLGGPRRRPLRLALRIAGFLAGIYVWGTIANLLASMTPYPLNGGVIEFLLLGAAPSLVCAAQLAYRWNVATGAEGQLKARSGGQAAHPAALATVRNLLPL